MFPDAPASNILTIQQYIDIAKRQINSYASISTSKLSSMLTWSSSNKLEFNVFKTKALLFTTSQMEKLHGLEQDVVKL